MSIDMSQFHQVFFEEAAEHLADMESLLLKIDIQQPEAESLNAIFRAAHSIKGGAGTFGFNNLTEVTHILENLLDRIRKHELALTSEMVDVFLEAGDVLKGMLDAHQNGGESDEAASVEICDRLHALTGGQVSAPPKVNSPSKANTAVTDVMSEQSFQLALKLPEDLLSSFDLDDLEKRLKGFGTLNVLADLPRDDAGMHRLYTFDTASTQADLIDMFSFLLPEFAFEVTPLHVPDLTDADDGSFGFFTDKPAPDTLVLEESDGFGLFAPLTADEQSPVADILEEGDGFGLFAPLPEAPIVAEESDGFGLFTPLNEGEQAVLAAESAAPATPEAVVATAAAVEKPKVNVPAKAAAPAASAEASSIRVGVEKVDQIINLVGELVITQAMLAQIASQFDPVLYEQLHNGIALLERNTRELQESAMSIRMMPISFVFSRFPRVVRDVAGKLGKQVELVLVGENTEMDKGLIEKLADPLTHLVRNSLDHGIEKAEDRIAKGKPAKGTLTLKAFHQGGNIMIQVMDDGGGLSRDRILAKAKSSGMNVSDTMPDQEVWSLIFEAGFSTAEKVTDVSGRGVGMDVVRRNIQSMGGRIDIESVKDQGTTMSIRLPLTLAILDGMSISVGPEVYVIPLAFIVESLQPRNEDINTLAGKGRVIHVRGEYLPLVALHDVFNIEQHVTEFDKGLVIILEADGGKIALFVDDLLGQHQVVIKSLETNYRKVSGVSGATIMGDGRVALIIDVEALFRMTRGKQAIESL
ncbi:chemotaxis protein CheW [Leeia sp. TBRC 13508]|uniref:Chemotaxis protein CheA n=1 Tax=Leeia speluncae TaxID=2884804 RepID=A0ABS8D3L8_9NEIS|nr:chemotaxis protein CheW [Leeia speluncae]MCB6182765.1 chemotaxis protein CheW [Leeia speluncae]